MPRGSSKVNSGSSEVGVSGKANIDVSVSGTGAIDGATKKIEELNKKLAKVNQRINSVKKDLSETQQFLSQTFNEKSVNALTADHTKELSHLKARKSKIVAEINAAKQKNSIEKKNTNEVNNQLSKEMQKVAEANKRNAIEKEINGSASKNLNNEQVKTKEAQRREQIEKRINQELERKNKVESVYGNKALLGLIDRNLPGFRHNRMMTNATLGDLRYWSDVYGDFNNMPSKDFVLKYKNNLDIINATYSKDVINGMLQAEIGKGFTKLDMFFDGIGRQMWSLGRKIRIVASSFYAIRNAMNLLQNSMAGIDEIKEQAYGLSYYDKYNHSQSYLTNNLYAETQKVRMPFAEYSSIVRTLLENNLSAGSAMNAEMLASVMARAARVGGASDKGASNAINALLSAMVSGELKSEGIKQIQSNSIGLIDTIIQGLTKGVNEGIIKEGVYANLDIDGLKKLADEAKLTSSVVLRALSLMNKEVEEKFKKTPQTFTQSMSVIGNIWNKLMYDMSQNGRGMARISDAVAKLSNYLSTKEGAAALERFANAIDILVKYAIKAVEALAGGIDFLNKTVGAENLMKTMLGIGAFRLGKNVLFGSSFFTPEGNMKQRPGVFGSGGLFNTIVGTATGRSNGGLLAGAISTVRNITSLAVISANLNKTATATETISTIVDANGQVLSTVSGTVGKTLPGILSGVMSALPLLAGIIGAIGALGAVVALVRAKQESDAIQGIEDNKQNAINGIIDRSRYTHLTEADFAEAERKIAKYIDNKTTVTKSLLGGVKTSYSGLDLHDLDVSINKELYAKDIAAKNELSAFENQQLKYSAAIANNTGGTFDLTEDYLRDIADMRTRTFRGELLMGSNRVNNNITLNVAYTGDVADFNTKVMTALDQVMTKAKETRLT